MMELPQIIVLISKSLIRVARVEGGDLQDPIEMEWKVELLRKAFAVIKSRYHTARIRLVLDDDLSHTLDLVIPAMTTEQEERGVVESKLKEQIPEVLTAGNWDYKVKALAGESKTVTVFVPVQEIFIAITEAASKEGISIEAVEPITIVLTRDPNPFLGMAKKTDLRGDDEEVLNIQPIFAPTESTGSLADTLPEEKEDVVQPSSHRHKKTFEKKYYLFAAGGVLVVLLTFGIVKAIKKSGPKASPSPSPVTVSATPTPTPTPTSVDITTLKLQVLNGSGVVGQAGVVDKLLTKAGFAKAETGNATSYTYKKTEVQLKSSLPDSVYTKIAAALESDYTVIQTDNLSADSEFDVVVTVGTSKSLPSPTPKPSVSPSPKASASPSTSASGSPKPSASSSPVASPSPSSSN